MFFISFLTNVFFSAIYCLNICFSTFYPNDKLTLNSCNVVTEPCEERSSVAQVVQKQIEAVETALDSFISANNNYNLLKQQDDQQEAQEQVCLFE